MGLIYRAWVVNNTLRSKQKKAPSRQSARVLDIQSSNFRGQGPGGNLDSEVAVGIQVI